MTSVSAAHGGDVRGMARGGEPVVDRGADPPALDRRIARPVVTGNQQHHAVAGRYGAFETTVDRLPRAIEVHAVEVEHAVGLDRSALQPPIPATIESRSGFGFGGGGSGRRGATGRTETTAFSG